MNRKQYLSLLLLCSCSLLLSAPVPVPRKLSPGQELIGRWKVLNSGYPEIWIFRHNGTWTCKREFNIDTVHGSWEIRYRNYLYIKWGCMDCYHVIGSQKWTKIDTRNGDMWPNLSLRFVNRISRSTH